MDNELEQMIIKQKIKIKQLKKEIANNKEIVNEYSYNGQRYNNQNIDLKRENFLLKRKINENEKVILQFMNVAQESRYKIELLLKENEQIKKENIMLKKNLNNNSKNNKKEDNSEEILEKLKREINVLVNKKDNNFHKHNNYTVNLENDNVIKLTKQNQDLIAQNKLYENQINNMKNQIQVLTEKLNMLQNVSTTIHSNTCCLNSRSRNFGSINYSFTSDNICRNNLNQTDRFPQSFTYEI